MNWSDPDAPRERAFNVPRVVLALIALLVVIHAIVNLLLSEAAQIDLLELFAFVPGRYDATLLAESWPGGRFADVWTFVSYALLHADLMHLGVNVVWLLAFGSPLAWRFGPWRFLAFLAVTSAAGAGLHLVFHEHERIPMIGASAAISGAMAASMRFAFQPRGPIFMRGRGPEAYRVRALPLLVALRDFRVLAFLAVWFGINLIFGLGSFPIVGEGQSVAWQAHVGGFIAGLVLFGLFDPVRGGPDSRLAIERDARGPL
jgi:membrane associated rhomboid family serine protease